MIGISRWREIAETAGSTPGFSWLQQVLRADPIRTLCCPAVLTPSAKDVAFLPIHMIRS